MAHDPHPDRGRSPSSPAEPGASQERSRLRSAFAEIPAALRWPAGGAVGRGEALWALVVLAMVLDVALTGVGLSLGLRERNPVAIVFIDRLGLLGAGLLLKGFVLGVGVGNWLLLPRLFPTQRHRRYLIPLGLAVPSWSVVAFNAALVLSVL